MMEKWEQDRVDRLENRIAKLERKNWERADFTFKLIMYGLMGAFIALTVIAVAVSASHPPH
jgi:hypothetical protein